MKNILYTLITLCSYFVLTTETKAQSQPTNKIFSYTSKCLKTKKDNFSFSQFDPERRGIYPRNDRTLFRAYPTTSELSLSTFMRGVMGDNSAFFSSFSHSLIAQQLIDNNKTKQETDLNNYFTAYGDLNRFASLKACIAKLNGVEKVREANIVAADILNEVFYKHLENNVIPERYLDYQSRTNVDYFNQPHFYPIQKPVDVLMGRGEIIFATSNYRMTSIYPREYLVSVNQSELRSIDLNYWNKNKYGSWVHHENDTDEFITMGFFESKSFISLYKRSMNILSIKMKQDDTTYILLTTLNNETKTLIDTPNSEVRKYLIPIFGIVTICPQTGDCPTPTGIIDQFDKIQISAAGLTYLENELKEANVFATGSFLKFHPAFKDTSIKIKKATYGDQDVTKQVLNFCQNKMRCSYKFKHSYVFPGAQPTAFKGSAMITFTCGDREPTSVTIAEPAEDKIADLQCK